MKAIIVEGSAKEISDFVKGIEQKKFVSSWSVDEQSSTSAKMAVKESEVATEPN